MKGAVSIDQLKASAEKKVEKKVENGTKIKLINGIKVDPVAQANAEKQEYYRSLNIVESGEIIYTSRDTTCLDNSYTLTVDGGLYQTEVSWELLGADSTLLYEGGAPSVTELCLLDGDLYLCCNGFMG
jgi:hypothetical protein